MIKNIHIYLFLLCFFSFPLNSCSNIEQEVNEIERPPNIILILADDLGYADLEVYGNTKVHTPHTDRLAKEGIRFTDFHSNGANCSPTRAALLTGRYQQRTGVETVRGILSEDEITIGEYLQDAGYRTGVFGKWHVTGHLRSVEFFKEKNPVHYGFDEFKGFMSGFIDYQSHIDPAGNLDWWHNDQLVNEEGYATHLITDHAVNFIEQNHQDPFFLYMSYAQIHMPFMTPDDPPYFKEGVEYTTAGKHPVSRVGPHDGSENMQEVVNVMIEEMDKSIGQLIQTIENLGIEENTLVFFVSDNGGLVFYSRGGEIYNYGQISSMFPYRGQKGTLYEGGHRVPAIAWWPGHIPAGKVSDETLMTHDLLPTFLELSGIDFPDSNGLNKLDGVSLVPLLLEEGTVPDRKLFWKLRDMRAVREGDWKFVKNGEEDPELYNLKHDPGETNNLATYFPGLVDSFLNDLVRWEEDVYQE